MYEFGGITVVFDYAGSSEGDDILRCLETLYSTPTGTCPLDRDFGIDMAFLDKPPEIAKNELSVEIIEKTETYEPRVEVEDIDITMTEGKIYAEVTVSYE